MKNIVLVLISISLLSVISCKEEEKVEKKSQMEKVIAIHDEAMSKLGLLGKLVSQLKPMADSLGPKSAEAKAIKDLQEANRGMMDWMQFFGDRFDFEETMNGKELTKEKQQWLKEEEEKVKKVEININSSIERAEALLKD
jgi:hypothetical protein